MRDPGDHSENGGEERMKSRYCYCPMTAKRIGRRVTLASRIRRWLRNRKTEPDLFMISGYYAPYYPGK